jgi:hypothetical protein
MNREIGAEIATHSQIKPFKTEEQKNRQIYNRTMINRPTDQ